MAQEAQASVSLSAVKDGNQVSREYSFSLDMATDDMEQETQVISHTSWTALDFSTFSASPAQGFTITNNDQSGTANYIQIAIDNAGAHIFARVKPGQSNLITPDAGTSTYYAKAALADLRVEIVGVGF